MATIPRIWPRSVNPLANTRAMYLFAFMASGAFQPFINLYFSRQGLTGIQIGALAALPVLVGTVASFFWSALADTFRLHRQILSSTLFIAPLTVLFLLNAADRVQTAGIVLLMFSVALYALFGSALMSLLDGSALELAKTHKRSYGELRVWGSIGWSVATWLIGTLMEKSSMRWLFYGNAIFLGVTFLLSFFQPAQAHVLHVSPGQGFRRLIRRDVIIFFVSVFFLAGTSGAGMSFLSIYLDHIGAGEGLVGLSWTFSALSEIPVMYYSGAIMKRIGARKLLILAFLLYALRWLAYSSIETPLLVLPVQVLQGVSFAAFLASGVTYLNERTPEGLTTTAQAIFNSVTFGLASMAGALSGGYLYDTVGMMNLFRILSLVALGAFSLFVLAPHLMTESRAAVPSSS